MNSSTFSKVEIGKSYNASRGYMLEFSSIIGIILCVIYYALFGCLYLYVGGKCPETINKTSNIFYVKEMNQDVYQNVAIKIAPLSPLNKVLSMKFSFVRNEAASKHTLHVETNGSCMFYGNNSIAIPIHYKGELNFDDYDKNSDDQELFNILGSDYLYGNLNLSFKASMTDLMGIRFEYSFGNVSVQKLINSVKLVLFVCSIYGIISYSSSLCGSNMTQGSFITILLGIFSAISLNPASLIMSFNSSSPKVDMICGLSFMFFFRFYCLYVLISCFKNSFRLSTLPLIACLVYAFAYTSLEFYVHMNDNPNMLYFFLGPDIGTSVYDTALSYFHVCHCALFIIMMIVLIIISKGPQLFRSVSYSIFILFTLAGIIAPKFFFEKKPCFNNSIFPSLVYITSHTLASIVFLFFHLANSNGYTTLDEPFVGQTDDTLF